MKKLVTLLIGVSILFSADWAMAQKKKKKDGDEKKDKFAEITKDATFTEGFIDSYRKDGHLYLAITPDMLNRDFLMTTEIAEGIGAGALYGGTMLNIFEAEMLSLEKHDGKIFLVQKPTRYTADENSATSEAVDLTYGNSVLESGSIEATNEDSVMLVDAYGWFVSDLSNVSQRVEFATSPKPGQPGQASFDKSRSYLESVDGFPDNTNIQAKLTFTTSGDHTPRTVADGRYIPVTIHYSLIKLPEEPMEPRHADDRVGYFMTVHKDFSKDSDNFFKRYVNRWRLECTEATMGSDPCEVKEPITYYIDRTVPEKYRKPLMEGVELWGDAFEAAGFKDAIKAEMLPEGADAEDVRYPTLRWNTSDQPGYGAIGPSAVDPRTGEILDADILFEANMLLGFKSNWRNLVDPSKALRSGFEVTDHEMQALNNGLEMSNFGAQFSDQGLFLRTALLAKGVIKPGEPVPKEYINEALRWVTMHEVGHTLGLRHNFRSSADTPLDQLHDKEWTKKNGVFGSVMEYPTPNVSPEGVDNGYYYNPGVGSYDRWAVSYGYTPDDEEAAELARQGAKDGHAYGTDEDAFGRGALDPSIDIFDLSGDPLAWSEQRIKIIRNIIPELDKQVLADNVAYFELTEAFENLLGQYAGAVGNGIKYLGGQYQYRDHQGDPQERGPYRPLSVEDQNRALDLIVNYGFSEDAFMPSKEIYQKFGADRWSHWGNSNNYNGRIDYPLHEKILNIQTILLGQLTHPFRLARMRDAETKYGAGQVVGIPEMMNDLTEAVWSEVWSAPGKNIPAVRRDLQRAYLDRMSNLLIDPPARTPSDARSVIRYRLNDLNDRIESRLTPPTYEFDDYTRAHLEDVQAQIEKILEASLEMED